MMQDVLRHVRAYLCDVTPEALEYKELREMLNYAPHDEMDDAPIVAATRAHTSLAAIEKKALHRNLPDLVRSARNITIQL